MMATDAGFRETLAYNCGPLFMDALKNPEVIEIMLNPDGMLWIERYGQDQEPIGTMEPVRSRAVLSLVASALDLTVNDHSPIIEGEFPLDGSRFEATFPPIVSAPSFSLRKKASKVMSVEDYVADGVITPAVVPFLEHAVVTRKNIMVVVQRQNNLCQRNHPENSPALSLASAAYSGRHGGTAIPKPEHGFFSYLATGRGGYADSGQGCHALCSPAYSYR